MLIEVSGLLNEFVPYSCVFFLISPWSDEQMRVLKTMQSTQWALLQALNICFVFEISNSDVILVF